MPVAVPPGTIGGFITTDTEFLDTSGTYFLNNLTVTSGATLTVGNNVRVQINGGQTLTVSGTVNVFSAASFVIVDGVGNGGIVVGNLGTMYATATNFTRISSSTALTSIQVGNGGRLVASDCTFDWEQLTFAAGSVVQEGGVPLLSNNRFELPISVPWNHIPLLATNRRFETINIQGGGLGPDQILLLQPIGTDLTSNSLYAFAGNFSVGLGATLTVAANTRVQINGGQTLTVNGTLEVVSAASFVIVDGVGNGGIVVGNLGTMYATATSFTRISSSTALTSIQVGNGGRLVASDCTFDWEQLTFAAGSVLQENDLSNNRFELPVSVPWNHIPLLATNRRFETINIQGGGLGPDQILLLQPIGTDLTSNPLYAFAGNFSVGLGATLTVAANTRVQINGGQTLTVSGGVLNVVSAASFVIVDGVGNGGIVVGNLGTMNATATNFTRISSSTALTSIQVSNGGRLLASDCTFDWEQLTFAAGSVLQENDLSNNRFELPISVPWNHIPLLATNRRFETINIQGGGLGPDQILLLQPIGTDLTSNPLYAFAGNFSVGLGATLTVAANTRVQINGGQTLTVNGTLEVVSAASFVIVDGVGNGGIVVGNLGTMNATATNFTRISSSTALTSIQVGNGGRLTASQSTFAWENVTLNVGSTAVLRFNIIATQLAINSGAAVTISQNDLSSPSGTVVAVGTPSATIDLSNNYWGTTSVALIEGKITHNPDPPVGTRPTVNFQPFLTAPPPRPAAITGLAFNDLNGNGTRDGDEPGLGGVVVFLDVNNNGALDTDEPLTVTRADDSATPSVDETGQYRFGELLPGTYVVRALAPDGFVLTLPSPAAVATTVFFDNSGDEAGVTVPGVSSFSFRGAGFSGGTVFSPPQAALRASGAFAYVATGGSAAVNFNRPIDSVTFFYVHGFGFATGTATAFAADGSVLGTVSSNAATTSGDPANFVSLDFGQPIARIQFSGGVIDDFTFTTQADDSAYLVHLAAGQTAGGIDFGIHSSDAIADDGDGLTVNAPGDGTGFDRWTVADLLPGVHRILLSRTADPDRVRDATFHLFDDEGFLSSVLLDQRQAPDDLSD